MKATRLRKLSQNQVIDSLTQLDAYQRQLKRAQFIGGNSGAISSVTQSASTTDLSWAFNTGSLATIGTMTMTFLFTPTSQAYPFARVAATVSLDTLSNAITYPTNTATTAGASISAPDTYFAERDTGWSTANQVGWTTIIEYAGNGTLLIKWSVIATDTGTISFTGSYNDGTHSGTVSG